MLKLGAGGKANTKYGQDTDNDNTAGRRGRRLVRETVLDALGEP